MEWVNDNEPIFPPEFIEFEKPVQEAKTRINQIEETLSFIPPDRGPRFELRPLGMRSRNDFNEQWRKELLTEKAAIQTNLKERVEQGLKEVDPAKAQQVRETLDAHVGSNRFKAFGRFDLKQVQALKKNIDASFDYVGRLHSDQKAQSGYKELLADKKAADRFFAKFSQNKIDKGNSPEIGGPDKH